MADEDSRKAQPYRLTTMLAPTERPWRRPTRAELERFEWLGEFVKWPFPDLVYAYYREQREKRRELAAQEAARYPRADPASAVERPWFGVEIECIEYISESDRGYDNSLTSDESDGSEASANEILRHSADVLRDVYGDPTGPRPNNTPDGSEPESDEIEGSVTASEANQQEAKEIRDTALQRRKDWLRNAYQQLNNSEIEASITGFGPTPYPDNVLELEVGPALKAACRTYRIARFYIDEGHPYSTWQALNSVAQSRYLRMMLVDIGQHHVYRPWVPVMQMHCREYFAILQRAADAILPEMWDQFESLGGLSQPANHNHHDVASSSEVLAVMGIEFETPD